MLRGRTEEKWLWLQTRASERKRLNKAAGRKKRITPRQPLAHLDDVLEVQAKVHVAKDKGGVLGGVNVAEHSVGHVSDGRVARHCIRRRRLVEGAWRRRLSCDAGAGRESEGARWGGGEER